MVKTGFLRRFQPTWHHCAGFKSTRIQSQSRLTLTCGSPVSCMTGQSRNTEVASGSELSPAQRCATNHTVNCLQSRGRPSDVNCVFNVQPNSGIHMRVVVVCERSRVQPNYRYRYPSKVTEPFVRVLIGVCVGGLGWLCPCVSRLPSQTQPFLEPSRRSADVALHPATRRSIRW
jgi:hypothetical protein